MPKRAPPDGDGLRVPTMTRLTKEMREKLEKAASDSGRSLAQEVEFRLNRDFSWEATKRDIDEMAAEAKAARDAARVQAIRDAGFQLVRDMEGRASTVNISLDMLHAEADGRLRSGFIAAEDTNLTVPEAVLKRIVAEALEEAGIARPKKSAA